MKKFKDLKVGDEIYIKEAQKNVYTVAVGGIVRNEHSYAILTAENGSIRDSRDFSVYSTGNFKVLDNHLFTFKRHYCEVSIYSCEQSYDLVRIDKLCEQEQRLIKELKEVKGEIKKLQR